ncbi:MAG: NAD(P)-dependent oxidoreductase [Candidatus Latescibacterota bacterium]|nr:NAD(P)-dependent oxidoreductase [Candidatus Latescibacterota bacterium]
MAKRKTTSRKKSKKDFKIGFVGVGRMGANMARNLVENGFTISAVSDANTRSARTLAKELGCAAPKKLSEVTALSDVVITVVTDDASMRSIFSASGDSLLTEAKGTTFINCATISPATHVLVEKRAEKVGASSLEGCMASSITQARQGTLYLMCGGKRSVFNKVRPILDALSVSLRYIGTAGQAAQVKALVNMVMNINTAGLAEGLGLGKSLGLDLKTLMSVFSQTGANSRVLETDGEDMVIRDHECYFSADHAAKDSGIALKLANEQGLNLPLATATKAQFEKMKKLGIGGLDKSGIAELTFPGRKGDKGGKGGKKK